MNKLGLIGGTGPESTIEYYRKIEYGVQRIAGGLPRLTIESMSVFDVLSYCARKDYDGLTRYLLGAVRSLADAGCGAAALTGITPHIVFEELSAQSPIPVISMIEAACSRALDDGLRKVVLLGTYPTMSGNFFQRAFHARGIDVVTPEPEEMRYIGGKIETEIELGQILPETQKRFADIALGTAKRHGAGAVVLGCTELPLILNEKLLGMPCLDVMEIHIERLISFILEDQK